MGCAAEVQVEPAGQAVRNATEAMVAYECGVAAQALDCQILDLEAKLLRALVERRLVSGKRNDSLWNLRTLAKRCAVPSTATAFRRFDRFPRGIACSLS